MTEFWTDEFRVAVMRHYEAFTAAFGCRGQTSLLAERNGDITLCWTEFDQASVLLHCKPAYFLDAPPHDTFQQVAGIDLSNPGRLSRTLSY